MKTVEFNRPDRQHLNIEIIRYTPDDASRNATSGRHRHNFHSIFFILEGQSKQEVDFEPYQLEPGTVMIIPKGSVHWEQGANQLGGYVILFSDDFFSELQKGLFVGFVHHLTALGKLMIPLSADQQNNLETYFELLRQEQNSPSHQNHTFLLQNLMLALLNKLEGIVQNLPEVHSFISTRQLFQQFAVLVEAHFRQQNTLDFYTSELHVTSRKLNEVVKKVTGQTASAFIIDRILIEARRELCFTNQSIKEVAIALGYENQYYFSRLFKSKTGQSPEQFRKAFAQ